MPHHDDGDGLPTHVRAFEATTLSTAAGNVRPLTLCDSVTFRPGVWDSPPHTDAPVILACLPGVHLLGDQVPAIAFHRVLTLFMCVASPYPQQMHLCQHSATATRAF